MTHFPAGPGHAILSLQDDHSVIVIPVIGYEVIGSVGYPISVIRTGGLLKARRALHVDGYIIDRGFPIPFEDQAAWVQWAKHQEPGEEEPEVIDMTGVVGRQQAERLARENIAPKPSADDGGKKAAAEEAANTKPRKTFASKSFWAKTSPNGSTEIAEIEPGHGLPRDHEGWDKIKREEFAAFKRDSKGPDATVSVVTWGKDGPVEPEDIIEPHADAGGIDLDDDAAGLV